MSVTVRDLFRGTDMKYHARLVAGANGLGNIVDWVHIVEDKEVGLFLHGHEVVFTAGILNRDEGWLPEFVRNLYTVKISAFVINLGPYTKDVSEEVIRFCDKVGLPLFTIPWKTRMVDMTRDFVERIFRAKNRDQSLSTTVKDLIFGTGDPVREKDQLSRYGFRENYRWTFIGVSFDSQPGTDAYAHEEGQVRHSAEYLARQYHEQFVRFIYRDKEFLLLVDYTDEEVKQYTESFVRELSWLGILGDIHIGVGENIAGAEKQRASFERAFSVSCLARRRGEKVVFYGDLDIDRLLIGISDKDLMRNYFRDTLGKLVSYDETNGTDLFGFLRVYLENDCSPQAVSDALYIHRNTVGNYLKKVENVLGLENMNLEKKAMLLLAYRIFDLLREAGPQPAES